MILSFTDSHLTWPDAFAIAVVAICVAGFAVAFVYWVLRD